jgi:membrane protein implicated in regulation of membrane protease activity
MVDPTAVVLQVELFNLGLPMLLLLAGVALIVMEALAPGAHFIVVGIALLVAGLVGLALSSFVGAALLPVVLGVVVLVVGALTFFAYRELDIYGGKGQAQTSDSDSLKGASGRVTERVTEREGEVKLQDGGFNPYYRARSVDGEIAEGQEVIVVDPGGGNVLTVMSVDDDAMAMDEIDRALARGESEPAEEAETETDVETS